MGMTIYNRGAYLFLTVETKPNLKARTFKKVLVPIFFLIDFIESCDEWPIAKRLASIPVLWRY